MTAHLDSYEDGQLYSSVVGHDYDAHPFCGPHYHYYFIEEEVEAQKLLMTRDGHNGGDCFIKNYNLNIIKLLN